MTGAPDEECTMKTVKDYIRTIPDFPHEGIMFRDVTTLFADPRGLRLAIDQLLHPYAGVPVDTRLLLIFQILAADVCWRI